MEKGYKKLIVWQRADELSYQIYMVTKKFPHYELYGITSQLRRAAISIPTNIAEGAGRQNRNEFKRFLSIALGSLAEVEYLLEFSCRLALLDKKDYEQLESVRKEVGALLWKFYKTF